MQNKLHYAHPHFKKTAITGKEKSFARQAMWKRPVVSRVYSSIVVRERNGKQIISPNLQYLALNGNSLIINGHIVPDQCTSHQGTNISWRYGKEGFYTSGSVNFHHHMIGCYGHVYIGSSQENAVMEFFSAGTDPVTLDTQISKTGQTPGENDHWSSNDPNVLHGPSWLPTVSMSQDNFNKGPQLQYYWDAKLGVPVINIIGSVDNITESESFSYDYDSAYCVFDVDQKTPNHNLIFDLSEYEDALSNALEYNLLWPFRARIEFDVYGESFTGWITEADNNFDKLVEKKEPGKQNPILFYWKGSSDKPTNSVLLTALSENVNNATENVLVSLGDASSGLDGSDLLLINVPSTDIQCESLNLITQNMTWSLYKNNDTQKWVNNFIGTTCPALDSSMINNINNDVRTDKKHVGSPYSSAQDWYRNSLGMYWIGWGIGTMSGAGAPNSPLSTEEQNKFKYWNTGAYGDDKRPTYGLPSESYYSSQTKAVYNQSFFNCAKKTCPNLARYLEDQNLFNTSSGKQGHDWAQWYLDQVGTPSMLAQQVIKMKMSGDSQMLNTYCSLLALLDPPENHAQNSALGNDAPADESKAVIYYERVMSIYLRESIEDITWQSSSQPDLAKWISEVFSIFSDTVIRHHNAGDSDYQVGGIYYQDYVGALQLQQLKDTVGAWSDLSDKIVECIVAAKQIEIYPRWLENVSESFWNKISLNPKAQALGKSICKGILKMAISGVALWGLIMGYKSWDTLDGVQKVNVVMGTIGMVFNAMQVVLDIYEKYIKGDKTVKPVEPTARDIKLELTGPELDEYLFNREARARKSISPEGSSWEVGMADSIKTECVVVERDGTMALKEGSWFSRMVKSGAATKVMQGIGVIIGFGMTVLSTIQFIKDMGDPNLPAYEKAFDTIAYVAGLVSFGFQLAAFAGTVGLVSMTSATIATCAFASEILALVAIAFIIIFICCMPKPPSPADEFMKILRDSAWFKALRSTPSDWKAEVPYVEPSTANTIKQGYAYP